MGEGPILPLLGVSSRTTVLNKTNNRWMCEIKRVWWPGTDPWVHYLRTCDLLKTFLLHSYSSLAQAPQLSFRRGFVSLSSLSGEIKATTVWPKQSLIRSTFSWSNGSWRWESKEGVESSLTEQQCGKSAPFGSGASCWPYEAGGLAHLWSSARWRSYWCQRSPTLGF